MKNKFLAALLAGASLLTMTACGGNASADTGADANADTGAAAGDTAKVAVVQLVDNDAFTEMIDSFENKLTELYGDGVTYDVKNAQGDMSTLNSIASELKTADYDLVVPIVTPATQAVVNAGVTAPVVFISVTDPVAAGIMGDMAKPDKNATGTSNIVPVDEIFTLAGKLTPDEAVEKARAEAAAAGKTLSRVEEAKIRAQANVSQGQTAEEVTQADAVKLPPRTRCSRRRSRSQARLTRSTSRSTPPCSPRWRRSSRRRTQQASRFTALTRSWSSRALSRAYRFPTPSSASAPQRWHMIF